MDIISDMKKIGILETACNLAVVGDSSAVMEKVLPYAPFPPINISDFIEPITDWLLGFNKKKYMFFTPELALIEAMAQKADGLEAQIVIPADLDLLIAENIKQNLPKSMPVSVLKEPFYPIDFRPGNGIIVVCGWINGDRLYVFKDTFRMVRHYRDFKGKMVFIPYTITAGENVSGDWIEVDERTFNSNWRDCV